ncbi:carbohydrate diacid regulator [Pseudobutyrivibrio sp. ACV-2]|uniref:CdaR family transcriptional regulator n=1 Tax=Pseudobutyrivibrio sp. ACV-2 TaxID=1520801 RepID=UPI000898BB7F|nr:sugar diacid recognition domain-containing protein [Pseudobutyrivibrio sp. ACV-2]SEB02331.1 carbohydrate diacid regulator [Pseudobutyrivibrio sp. ACV-2]
MITSISKNLAQQIVDTIHDVCGYNINFINTKGMIYASNDVRRLDTYHEIGRQVATTGETIEVTANDQFHGTNKGINIPIYYHKRIIAVVGISGEPADVRKYAHLAERVAILLLHEQEINASHRTIEEKKQYLMHSLIYSEFDNPEYLEECFEEFKIDTSKDYRIVDIEINSRYNLLNKSLLEQRVETLFSSVKDGLYVYIYPNEFIGLIQEDAFSQNDYMFQIFSQNNIDIVKTAIGKASKIYKCKDSFVTARNALATLKTKKTNYVVFDNLTLEILFASLSNDIIKEFKSKILWNIDEDEKDLLRSYYDNEMSLQATSQALFIHKNTVQQRLNKIMSKTSYNPRQFRDAVILYLALIN